MIIRCVVREHRTNLDLRGVVSGGRVQQLAMEEKNISRKQFNVHGGLSERAIYAAGHIQSAIIVEPIGLQHYLVAARNKGESSVFDFLILQRKPRRN